MTQKRGKNTLEHASCAGECVVEGETGSSVVKDSLVCAIMPYFNQRSKHKHTPKSKIEMISTRQSQTALGSLWPLLSSLSRLIQDLPTMKMICVLLMVPMCLFTLRYPSALHSLTCAFQQHVYEKCPFLLIS